MKDKVVIVTGASSGIGRSCAIAFAKRKAKIVLAARQQDKLDELTKIIEAMGVEVLAVKTDVRSEQDCIHLIEKTVARFHTIDILINNAGISMRALFEDLELKVIREVMDTNFWGAIYCTKYALPYLLKSKGSVVGMSSISGKKALPGRTGYCASKFALEGFLETLRLENLKTGLHVLIACPGFTASNIRFTALAKDGSVQGESPRNEEKMMQPEEVAEHLIDAIIKRKRNIVLTTQGKLVLWINKFWPATLDKIIYNQMSKEPDSPLKQPS
ncbi:MAG: SDR family oxidoreductase [Bacteroidia bacterium]